MFFTNEDQFLCVCAQRHGVVEILFEHERRRGPLGSLMGLSAILSFVPSTHADSSLHAQRDLAHGGQALHHQALQLQCVGRQPPLRQRSKSQLWGAAQAARKGMPLVEVSRQLHKDFRTTSALLNR